VKRVGDLGSGRQHRVEHAAVGARQVQRRPPDGAPPRVGSAGEPGARRRRVAALHDIEQLAAADIDDRGRPGLGAPASLPAEQGLVQAQGVDRADPAGVLDQRGPIGDDGVVDGVPVTAQLTGQIGDGAATAADLFGHPPAGPVGHHQPGRRDPGRRLCEGPDRTARRGAGPPALVPHQAGRPAERREVNQLDRPSVLDPHRAVTVWAPRSGTACLDMDAYRTIGFVGGAEHADIAESDQQLADARRVNFHRGSRIWRRREPPDSQGPCTAPGILSPPSDPKRLERSLVDRVLRNHGGSSLRRCVPGAMHL
jgi:hypothetical protein